MAGRETVYARRAGAVRGRIDVVLGPVTTDAQDLSQLFRKASSSVAVIRATGRDVGASGEVRFNETGSGVLISRDGKVMTAAHVVQSMDEIASSSSA